MSLKKFFVSFFYGLHSVVERRPLWNSLAQFGTNIKHPWLILGDFNSVINTEDRQGHAQVISYEVRDFLNCCFNLGFVDINFTSSIFTWTTRYFLSELDWAICNQDWFTNALYTTARFFPPGCILNHSPCVVSLFHSPKRPKNCFMFFNIWCEHDNFLIIIEKSWNVPLMGTKQYILCRKLKLLKKPMMELNRKHFGHMSTKAEQARKQLKQAQILFHDNPHDECIKAMVRELQEKAVFYVMLKESSLPRK